MEIKVRTCACKWKQ